MASFHLEVGEYQEHSHQVPSTSVLVRGRADMIVGSRRFALEIGSVEQIPAQTSHTVVNTGVDVAVVKCVCLT